MLEGGFQVVAFGMLAREVKSARAKTLRSSRVQRRLSTCLIVGCATAPIPSVDRVRKELILTMVKN
jgi:hypothetical protein